MGRKKKEEQQDQKQPDKKEQKGNSFMNMLRARNAERKAKITEIIKK
jgi:hypothetical protein